MGLRALRRAWDQDIFSHSAQAAFWQALSLPPLLLGLLGSLGYVGDLFGPATVDQVERGIVNFSRQVFTPEVVDQIIAPTASTILTIGRADVISVGFLIALFAGSSATASLVDSITEAHGQKLVRHPVWQRIFSLVVYLLALVVAVLTLPLVALGPDLLVQVLPFDWQPTAARLIGAFYYPGTGLIFVLVLTCFYKLALPHSLPWRRLVPGALLAMLVFIASATGLRLYIAVLTSTGYTYGALATPIAFLLFAFLLGLSIVLGAHLNSAVETVWPARPTRRQRRLARLLSMRRIAAARAAGAPETAAPDDTGAPGKTSGDGTGYAGGGSRASASRAEADRDAASVTSSSSSSPASSTAARN
ncbi:MAG: YihY/virulence factor BrkB family protein, partial [Pseudonocardia sp.]